MPLLLCCSQASKRPDDSQSRNSNTIILDPLLRMIDTALSNYYEAVRRHYFTINKSRAGMLLQSILISGVRTNTLVIHYQSSNNNRTRWTKNMNYAESSSSSNNSRITARMALFSSSAATIFFLCSFSLLHAQSRTSRPIRVAFQPVEMPLNAT
jgi:hypothetical protein